MQYGLCQPEGGSAETFLLEEVPPVIPRPLHPAWGAGRLRNTVAHRPAFWALALLAEVWRRALPHAV